MTLCFQGAMTTFAYVYMAENTGPEKCAQYAGDADGIDFSSLQHIHDANEQDGCLPAAAPSRLPSAERLPTALEKK